MKKTTRFSIIAIFAILHSALVCADTTTHIVKQGETLSHIAKRHYKDGSKWPHIYRTNKNLIKDAEKINVGWELIIPGIENIQLKKLQDTQTFGDADVIRLVTGNGYFPFTDEKLPGDGMITEIVARVFEKMGKTVELEFWSWKLGYDAAKAGEFTATFPYLKDSERLKDFYYSKPLFNILMRGFVKNDSSIKFDSVDDLKGLTVCRPEGYLISDLREWVDKGTLSIRQPKEMSDCFHLLKNGKVDIVSTNEFEAKGVIMKEFGSMEMFKLLDKSFSEGPLHIIFSKSNPENLELLREFDQALEKLAKKGALQKIVKRHMMYYQSLMTE